MDKGIGQWFVLQTLTGQENKAKENIESALRREDADFPVYEVFIPTEDVLEVRKDKKGQSIQRTVHRKLFPGYVYVRMDLYKEDGSLNQRAWYFARETQGIIGFIGDSEKPQPLSKGEVADLEEMINGKDNVTPVYKDEYRAGDRVRITKGPFQNFEGVVTKSDPERGKLELEVSIFGRSTSTEVEFCQVEREQE